MRKLRLDTLLWSLLSAGKINIVYSLCAEDLDNLKTSWNDWELLWNTHGRESQWVTLTHKITSDTHFQSSGKVPPIWLSNLMTNQSLTCLTSISSRNWVFTATEIPQTLKKKFMQTTIGQEIELALKGCISVLQEKPWAGYTIPR